MPGPGRSPAEDLLLAELTAICLTLPEAVRERRGSHADFRVRTKVFAYYLDDHHGDGIVAVCCKTARSEKTLDREAGSACVWTSRQSIGARWAIW